MDDRIAIAKAKLGDDLIILGHHYQRDEVIRFADFTGDYANVHIQQQAFHETVDGRRLLVVHGHELDTVVQNMGWLAHVGDIGYQLLLRLNGPINFFRRLLGRGHWSLSAYVKSRVKNVVNFIGGFEQSMVHFAGDAKADGIICGHIHTAAIRRIKDLDYYNTGDWVESLTALVETEDGRLQLLQFNQDGELVRTLATCGTLVREGSAPVRESLGVEFPPEAAAV
jgi:UDP-2,3-diacylglucosamine pyrophosphatase LpxH